MPISVPGPGNPTVRVAAQQNAPAPKRPAQFQRGFSLLEVLIVLVIIGIATATVSVSAFSSSNAVDLRRDAQRLAQLFSVAQAEARKAGSLVVWEYDQHGYGFARAQRDLFLPTGLARQAGPLMLMGFADGGTLRYREWASDNAIEVRVEPLASNVFNDEWISGPMAVELSDGLNNVRIERLGNGQYQVLP